MGRLVVRSDTQTKNASDNHLARRTTAHSGGKIPLSRQDERVLASVSAAASQALAGMSGLLSLRGAMFTEMASATTRLPVGLVGAGFGDALSSMFADPPGLAVLTRALKGKVLSPNLNSVDEARAAQIMTLADEGLTLWRVPSAPIASLLLRADNSRERGRVLETYQEQILDDCAQEATRATAGDLADLARLLEQAISSVRAGHVAAGQALAACVLETLMEVAIDGEDRHKLKGHPSKRDPKKKVMVHHEELAMSGYMVFRPIWVAYRPQGTDAQRSADSSFARHGTAHHIRGGQVSRRNATQAIMLTAALLGFLEDNREAGQMLSVVRKRPGFIDG